MEKNNTIEALKTNNMFLKKQLYWFMKENRYNMEKRVEEIKRRLDQDEKEDATFCKMLDEIEKLRGIINQQEIIINNYKNDNSNN